MEEGSWSGGVKHSLRMKRVRYQGDTGLVVVVVVVVGLRAASGLTANYLYCARLAVFTVQGLSLALVWEGLQSSP